MFGIGILIMAPNIKKCAPKSWIVVRKAGVKKTNAAIDNHVNTEKKLLAEGWNIVGYVSAEKKADAIFYIDTLPPTKPRKRK